MIKDTSGQDEVITSSRRPLKAIIIGLVSVLLIGLSAHAIISQPSAQQSIDRAAIQIGRVEMGDLIRDVSATGRVVAANAPQVYSPEQGFVDLQVAAGDHVAAGQVVAVVESPELHNALQQQQSELQRLEQELARQELDARRQTLQLTKQMELAEVDLQAAEREERRAQASIETNLISRIDYEKAIDDLARARLTFKHAKEEVTLAKDTLAFELESARTTVTRQELVVAELERQAAQLTITASVTGVVGNLLTQQRALVAKNQALMTLVDLTAYEAELNVPESYANELALGLGVDIMLGGQKLKGRISSISPEVSEREVTTRVRFDQQSITGIRQNQQLSARILLENRLNVLKVRRGSFLQSGGFVAFQINGDIAQRVAIEVGATSMREVEIIGGLEANDQIIISNYDEFADSETLLLRN